MELESFEQLRLANPVDVDQIPWASQMRVRTKIADTVAEPRTSSWHVGAWPLLGAAAVVGTLGILIIAGGLGPGPGDEPGGSTGPISASCVDPYRGPNSISHRDFAFDGTVTAISDEQVTFTVNKVFRGNGEPTVTLRANGLTGGKITSAGGPTLTRGTRYLVAGDGDFVWACGYTQPYNEGVAAQWAAAIGA